jgi:hypothetical protein
VRKIIVSEFVTLDGVMEAPRGEPGHPHTGWVRDFLGPEQLRYKLDEVLDAKSLLIGRVTYESFAGAWPQRSKPDHGPDPDLERVADQLSEMEARVGWAELCEAQHPRKMLGFLRQPKLRTTASLGICQRCLDAPNLLTPHTKGASHGIPSDQAQSQGLQYLEDGVRRPPAKTH